MSFVLACVRGHQDIVDKLLRYVCEPRHWRQTIPYFLYLVNIRGKQWQKTIFRVRGIPRVAEDFTHRAEEIEIHPSSSAKGAMG